MPTTVACHAELVSACHDMQTLRPVQGGKGECWTPPTTPLPSILQRRLHQPMLSPQRHTLAAITPTPRTRHARRGKRHSDSPRAIERN